MAQNKTALVGRVVPDSVRVAVLDCSPTLRGDTMYVPLTNGGLGVVQASTKVLALPVMNPLVVNGAALVYTTIPACAGGTATIQIDYVNALNTVTTNIVAATSILALTNSIPLVLTLAATNPTTCAAGGSILVTVVTSNNAVGTADVGGTLTIAYQGVDPNPITD
jgi:hypothetical protein